jgi:hypothetical protein
MAVPTTREEFKSYCLRKLGQGILMQHITDDQVDDRVDEALKYFWDYHFDGSDKVYLRHQITQDDIDNKYIPISENIMGVVKVFDVGGFTSLSADNIFSFTYQFALNEMHKLNSVQMMNYYIARMNVNMIDQILNGSQQIRFSRHINRLYIDMNWNRVSVGQYIVVEAYQIIDPEEFADVWSDRWLAKYATALIKKQIGTNTKKYDGMAMPGGVRFNGQLMYEEAEKEIEYLEAEMINTYSIPVAFDMG